MPSRRRIRNFAPTVSGGGGTTPTFGNVAWGPNFGELQELTVGASGPTMSDLRLAGEIDLGVTVTMPTLAAVYSAKELSVHLSGTALGAPFWQSEAHFDNNSLTTATTVTVTKPSGTVSGDLLVAHIASVQGVVTDWTAPTGWTLINKSNVGITNPTTSAVYWKIAGGSEPADYTWTWLVGSSNVYFGEIHRIIGTHATTPINASAHATLLATALDADPDSPAVTTTAANCLVMSILAHDHLALSQTHTPPGTHTERTDHQGSNLAAFIGAHSQDRVFAAIGVAGGVAHDCTETVATNAVLHRIAIAPGTVVLAP